MTFWLLKTEPGDFSYDDLLERDVEPWDGVSSPFALANLKNAREGETCVIYHTGDEKRGHRAGPGCSLRLPGSQEGQPAPAGDRRPWHDALAPPGPALQIKADPRFALSPLVRMGRLSVVPLTDEQYVAILEMAGL